MELYRPRKALNEPQIKVLYVSLSTYLGWPLDINGSKLSFYGNIFLFLSQYRVRKCLV